MHKIFRWVCESRSVPNTRATPKLPRVNPEDLVEGKWYVYDYHSSPMPMIGKYMNGKMFNSHDESANCWVNEYVSVWGPIELEDA